MVHAELAARDEAMYRAMSDATSAPPQAKKPPRSPFTQTSGTTAASSPWPASKRNAH